MLLVPNAGNAQEFECGIDSQAIQSLPRETDCSEQSATFMTKYRTPGFYSPNKSNISTKTILLNIVIPQNENANEPFVDVPSVREDFQTVIDSVNQRHANVKERGYNVNCPVPTNYITDSKIRFEINAFYFIPDTSLYYGSAGEVQQHMLNNYPGSGVAMNVIIKRFMNRPGFYSNLGGGYIATGQYVPSGGDSSYPWEGDSTHVYLSQFQYGHLNHELGHSLSLPHIYSGGGADEVTEIDNFDFLDDVYGTCTDSCEANSSLVCFQDTADGGDGQTLCTIQTGEVCHFDCDECMEARLQENGATALMNGRTHDAFYISPKQAGKMHRSLMLFDNEFGVSTTTHKFVKEKYPAPNDYVVSSDETWDFAIKMYQNIVVEPGTELTIKCELRMPIDGKIEVKPGAKLIVDGGKITSAHDDFWQGIDVWGNSDLPQTEANQGVVVLKNDAVIEHAREAVRLWNPGDWDSMGGIVEATNTQFINNRRSVEFMAYHNIQHIGGTEYEYPNESYFSECTFEWNDHYIGDLDSDTQHAHVTMWEVKGVNFSGCDFNSRGTVSTSQKKASGIESSDANYSVNGHCDVLVPWGETCPTGDFTPSTFTGFRQGIKALGSNANASARVTKAVFDSCMVGVKLQEAGFSEIVDNTFEVGQHEFIPPFPYDDDANYHTGIVAYETSHYTIEENAFNEDGPPVYPTHGALIESGGGASNSLYRNTYNNLSSASIAKGNNRNNSQYGLKFLCNFNSGNDHDFELREKTNPSNNNITAIASFQSADEGENYSIAAGNTFSSPDGVNDDYVHFDFESTLQYYYRYDDNMADEIPSPDETYITPPGDIFLDDDGDPNFCPSHFATGITGLVKPGKADLTTEFNGAEADYFGLKYTYDQVIDSGDTEGMINEIALTWPEDAWDLRDQLIARSPYNSEAVLIKAADKDIMPQSMLLEVLLANPDALRSGRVIDHVECCIPNPLPQYMLDLLYDARDEKTLRTNMERQLSAMHLKMTRPYKMMVQHYLTDSVPMNRDSLMLWLDKMDNIPGLYAKADGHANQKDFSAAISVLDTINTHFKLTSSQQTELNEMQAYYNLCQSVYNAGRSIAQMNKTETGELERIAAIDAAGSARVKADNILCFFYDKCNPPTPAPKSLRTASPMDRGHNTQNVLKPNRVSIAPNPADQYITFEYKLLKSNPKTTLRVLDAQGRKMETFTLGKHYRGQQLMDTRALTPGVYFIELVQEGEQLFSDKFIVQH